MCRPPSPSPSTYLLSVDKTDNQLPVKGTSTLHDDDDDDSCVLHRWPTPSESVEMRVVVVVVESGSSLSVVAVDWYKS
ncbi:hypothetical protein EJ110_NYTH24550 [Nymphaea thermarum]|nr:hypothetical protein EJ110_NYTH24550 [Nymphaea thermarum]